MTSSDLPCDRQSGSTIRAVLWLGIALVAAMLTARAGAQQQFNADDSAAMATSAVAPEVPAAPADPSPRHPTESANCAIYGTVTDSNGGIISGAKVTLSGPVSLSATSDAGGNFSFTKLPAGTFAVSASGAGMSPSQVPDIILSAGGIRFLPPVVLKVEGASTSVQVFANPEALAEQQVQLEMKQRVLGVMPDYYTSYDWNAVHMYPKQKFQLGFHSEIDWVSLGIIGAEAGVEQYYNRFPEWGTGTTGYAKRYAAAYATDFTGTMISDVALPTLFHQDPRYFFKGTGSFESRAWYAVSRSLICRGDDGHPEFDYSRVLGNIAAGGISNFYYPSADRGIGLTFSNAAIDVGANAATNLIREFILPGLITHGPAGVKNKGIIHF
ncbi:MAG TPA: carboxypeptidase-like regulatory domain-containing protein [Terracidiphilus sp.]|nr:carboxypeptidase-like regulatory domain-containing protein [Terracidiphilus sp.]